MQKDVTPSLTCWSYISFALSAIHSSTRSSWNAWCIWMITKTINCSTALIFIRFICFHMSSTLNLLLCFRTIKYQLYVPSASTLCWVGDLWRHFTTSQRPQNTWIEHRLICYWLIKQTYWTAPSFQNGLQWAERKMHCQNAIYWNYEYHWPKGIKYTWIKKYRCISYLPLVPCWNCWRS